MAATDSLFLTGLARTFDRTERTLLMLRYVEQLTLDEIALVLDLTHDEVTARLVHIRERTRQAIAGFQPEVTKTAEIV